MDAELEGENLPVRFKRPLEMEDAHNCPHVADVDGQNALLEPPLDTMQPEMNAVVFDLENLFGTQLESSFPDNWTPVSPATGDDVSVAQQSRPCSDEPEVGTSLGQSVESLALGVSTGPVLTQSMHDALFSRNLLSNCNVAGIELPWETEFYRDLFDEDDANKFIPKMPISDVCAVDPDAGPQNVAEAALPLTMRQILRLHDILTCEEAHITDRAVIAYILFALYGRFLEFEEPSAGSNVEIVSSHSLKATMLSWCARLNLSNGLSKFGCRGHCRALKNAGITTISTLAYAFGQPGQPIPSEDFTTWVKFLEPTASAFKRRGLALDFAGVMLFTRHDRCVQQLFAHLNRDSPAGYNRCSISQLIAADKAAWSTLIEKNVKPRPDAAGVLELDTKLEEALKSYEVSFTLLPLISKQPTKTSGTPSAPSKPTANTSSKGGKKGGQRYSPYHGKGKAKGKSKGGDQRIPKDIRDAGGTASTPDGQPICFDFSLKRCRDQVADGARHATLSHWLARGKALVQQEAEFHSTLHRDLQGILAPRRLLLWKKMMEYYSYPDLGVFDQVVSGVDLAGRAPFVESFDPSFKPAATTVGELAAGSKANRYALLSSVKSLETMNWTLKFSPKLLQSWSVAGCLDPLRWPTSRLMPL
eukprot:s1293_g2.t1